MSENIWNLSEWKFSKEFSFSIEEKWKLLNILEKLRKSQISLLKISTNTLNIFYKLP